MGFDKDNYGFSWDFMGLCNENCFLCDFIRNMLAVHVEFVRNMMVFHVDFTRKMMVSHGIL